MSTSRLLIVSSLCFTVLFTSACSEDPATSQQATTTETNASASRQLAANQGVVVETLAANEGYSYVQVRQGDKTFWVAGRQLNPTVGDVIEWGQASVMKNFTSKSLGRSFDEIYFVSTLNQSAPQTAVRPAQSTNEAVALRVENAGGYTYIQGRTTEGDRWVAVPTMRISEGDRFRWNEGALMRNFTSNALNHTFDEILFASQVQVANTQSQPLSQGTVVDVKQSGGYSYMQVNTSAGAQWVAAPAVQVSTGDTVQWSGASVMRNFHAASLDQTFDTILFAGAVQVR